MKFLHVSDIHLGKRLSDCDISEDQAYILEQILALAAREDVDAVLIAGDIYNRSQPDLKSLSQFNDFLTALAALGKPAFIVRGNHDSEAQIAYAGALLAKDGLYFSGMFDGAMQKVTLRDGHGPIDIWLLPYLKPMQVRGLFPDARIESYADAVSAVIQRAEIDFSRRNVLVTHYFVTGAMAGQSEELNVGGLDQIPISVFSGFDYVALGHIHRAQTLGGGRLRYCGAPMVYSFDECGQEKSATLVTVGEKGSENRFETIPFRPLHLCRILEGTLDELCRLPRTEDYVQIRLTDAERRLDPWGALKPIYPNLMGLTAARAAGQPDEALAEFEPARSPLEHFQDFYRVQNRGAEPTEAQINLLRELMEEEAGNS